jgi:DNA-binding FadR family transcriptional regulator
MIGPIFMFVARHANHFDWNETLKLHEELVDCINMGDTVHAKQSIERHLDNSLQRALKAFRGG